MHLSRILPLPRFEKEWHAEWNGHAIRVENTPRRERLWIDGALVHDHRSGALATEATLLGLIDHQDRGHRVSVHVALIHNTLSTGCHIFVDGHLIGGDTDKTLVLCEDSIPRAGARLLRERRDSYKYLLLFFAVLLFLWACLGGTWPLWLAWISFEMFVHVGALISCTSDETRVQ